MSSLIPSQTNTSQFSNCNWIITVTDCFGQEYFQLVYGVTTYLALFIFLCSIWLLSWRLYSKPDTKLFKIEGFLALEGYLFIQIFWGAARVINCLMLIYNLFAEQWIVRELAFDLSWFFGLTSVVTYLAGVLRTIPRMYFYRQNPHYRHATHLPHLRGILSVYVSYILVLGTIRITCAVLIGYFHQYPIKGSDRLIRIMILIYFCASSIGTFLVAIGFLVYGNKLVGIASEGLHLLEGLSGYPKRSKNSRVSHATESTVIIDAELELKHKKLKRSVRKMRIINSAFILSFVAMGILLGSVAFLYDQIFNDIEISKAIAAIANWMPLILNICVMGGIAYGEMRVPDKSEPPLENIIIPTEQSHTVEYTEHSQHSRNNSTDSDAPLLRWPAPVFTSTHKGSAQLDSPIGVTTSTSTTGSSAFATSSHTSL